MAQFGRLGCTITEPTGFGFRVSSICGYFRGTAYMTNGTVMINIEGKSRKFPGTLKGAVRRLRRMAHENELDEKIMTQSHDAMMEEINEQRISNYVAGHYATD